ncbi:MAG TPA: FIST N-terminal domain-containing protein [Opitutaceae bacterium]|nr:FIST N-terminal domain-containing protein [Opitutaceae bacterium]
MKLEQRLFVPGAGWKTCSGGLGGLAPQFVLLFGGRHLLAAPAAFEDVRRAFPGAHVISVSTSGEITGTEVTEDQLTLTAVAFEKTRVVCVATSVTSAADSRAKGGELASVLHGTELAHVFVVSDGALVNGTELARGFSERLPAGVALTGGLAGDGARFEQTLVGLDEPPRTGRVVAIGFYGRHLRTGIGSAGGWSAFGPERMVTRSAGNVLHELDGQSALHLYKKYLGEQAAELPGSALRFPLCVTPQGGGEPVVRTILSIDEKGESMTFAGDIPTGARVRFMRASYEDLIDGAEAAARQTGPSPSPELAICVSCVGRRIVLGQRTEEETEIVRETLGPGPVVTGFYSYGELAPSSGEGACQLHNQTMTITTLRED